MIISCILSSLSFVLAGASLDCNANMKHTQRMWIRRAGGVMLGIAGIDEWCGYPISIHLCHIFNLNILLSYTLFLPSQTWASCSRKARSVRKLNGKMTTHMRHARQYKNCNFHFLQWIRVTAALQAQRAFMVIAGLFSVVGLVAGALGLDCIHAIEGNGKIHASRAGGICIIFAGNCACILAKSHRDESNLSNPLFHFSSIYQGYLD